MTGNIHATDGAESAEEEEDDLRPIPSLSFNLFGSSGGDPKARSSSTSESSVLEPIRELDTSETASPATSESIPVTVRSTGGSTGAEPSSTTSTTASSDPDDNTGDLKAEEGSQEREGVEPSSVRSGSDDAEDERQTGEDEEEDEDAWTKGMAALLGILRQLGEATRKMEIYQCRHAILNFSKLPLTMQRSAYVLSSIGRCYYEMSDQDRAREAFEKLRRLWPNSTLNLALYSNILWHHRARHELSQLSNELVNLDARSPEAWCAMANAFSLEGDGSSAISALERAVQVRPSNSYPYTLLGQEYLAIDNHDRAFAAFREAVKLDSRHYRGWYGLGLLYYNQSKFTEAQAHFLRALEINPHSAILHTCLGLCFYAKRELGHTLPYLKMALNISPQNTTALYHLTSALISHAMAKLPINGSSSSSNPTSNKANIIDTNEIATMLSKLKTKLPTCGALHMLQGRYYRIMSIISDPSKKANFDAEGTAEFEAAKELDPKLNNGIMLADVVLYEPPELS
jgi:anaphase-promoting complex subunit 3